MKRPTKKLLGYTWVGWLNILVLQWLFLRLAYRFEIGNEDKIKFTCLKRIVPLTGWWNDYKYIKL